MGAPTRKGISSVMWALLEQTIELSTTMLDVASGTLLWWMLDVQWKRRANAMPTGSTAASAAASHHRHVNTEPDR